MEMTFKSIAIVGSIIVAKDMPKSRKAVVGRVIKSNNDEISIECYGTLDESFNNAIHKQVYVNVFDNKEDSIYLGNRAKGMPITTRWTWDINSDDNIVVRDAKLTLGRLDNSTVEELLTANYKPWVFSP